MHVRNVGDEGDEGDSGDEGGEGDGRCRTSSSSSVATPAWSLKFLPHDPRKPATAEMTSGSGGSSENLGLLVDRMDLHSSMTRLVLPSAVGGGGAGAAGGSISISNIRSSGSPLSLSTSSMDKRSIATEMIEHSLVSSSPAIASGSFSPKMLQRSNSLQNFVANLWEERNPSPSPAEAAASPSLGRASPSTSSSPSTSTTSRTSTLRTSSLPDVASPSPNRPVLIHRKSETTSAMTASESLFSLSPSPGLLFSSSPSSAAAAAFSLHSNPSSVSFSDFSQQSRVFLGWDDFYTGSSAFGTPFFPCFRENFIIFLYKISSEREDGTNGMAGIEGEGKGEEGASFSSSSSPSSPSSPSSSSHSHHSSQSVDPQDLPPNISLRATISLLGEGPSDPEAEFLSAWTNRVITPQSLSAALKHSSTTADCSLKPHSSMNGAEACAIVLDVDREFREFSRKIGFSYLFARRFRITLNLVKEEKTTSTAATTTATFPSSSSSTFPSSSSSASADVCLLASDSHEFLISNSRECGTLYLRILSRLLPWDLEQQQHTSLQNPLELTFHPMFPVLHIGKCKVDRYNDAIFQTVVEKKLVLPNAGWLHHVGRFLELLTCLGLIEAVRTTVGYDLLYPAERREYEQSFRFSRIRTAVARNAASWTTCWQQWHTFSPSLIWNLMERKQNATLGFMHAHHLDLREALLLAGPNLFNSQETWQRVFRDAERATLSCSAAAFPELLPLDVVPRFKNLLFWRTLRRDWLHYTPLWLIDRDGLYATACRQYRQSMNGVAEWARAQGLFAFPGDECITKNDSVLENYFAADKQERVAFLQRRDGYSGEELAHADATEIRRQPLMDASPRFNALLHRRRHLRRQSQPQHSQPQQQQQHVFEDPFDKMFVSEWRKEVCSGLWRRLYWKLFPLFVFAVLLWINP